VKTIKAVLAKRVQLPTRTARRPDALGSECSAANASGQVVISRTVIHLAAPPHARWLACTAASNIARWWDASI